MIKTKKELFEELKKKKKSGLAEFIEYKISERVLRELIDDRDDDNKYFFEKLDEINKRLASIDNNMKKKDHEIYRLKREREEWKKIAQGKN